MFTTANKGSRSRVARAAVFAVLCLALLIPQAANAAPITGELGFFSGSFGVTGGSDPFDLENATGVDFNGAIVVSSTGSFLANGVLPFSGVTLTDFTFDPFAGPVDPLWVVGIFEFALNSLTDVTQTATSLSMAGTGIVSTTVNVGLDATAFNWSFSGNNSGGTLQLFTSTSSPTPQPVAEPSELITLAFLAMGLATLGAWSRKYNKAVQQ